jgi:sulfate permease, SulP family
MGISLSRILSPFTPAIETAKHYSLGKFRRDVVAGLTVSVVEVPQAMAYAIIAGVPPQYGIYSSIIQGVLGALFSSSQHLTTGPTNTQSLLIAAAATRIAVPDATGGDYLAIVMTLCVLKGLIQFAFWALRFGELVQFISRSVILGIASGAAVLIVFGQLAAFLGTSKDPSSPLFGIVADIHRMIPHLHEISWQAIAIGVMVVAITLGAKMISKFIPGALIAVVLSAAIVAMTDLNVATVGVLDAGLPTFTMPLLDWGVWSALFSGAVALALLGGIETIAIAKSIASRAGERIDANQELFGQGVTNFASGFFQCIPGTASFTRSALDYDAGAVTRFAAMMNAVFVGAMFFLLQDYARYIPYAALAGVLFVVAWGLLETRYFFRVFRADRSDAIVFAVTFLSTILLPLQYAVFIGIFLNIAFYLRTSSRLHIAEMIQTETGGFIERPIYTRTGERRIIFIQLEGELFFAIADQLQDQLTAIRMSGVKVVIIRLKRCHSIDATVLHVIDEFVSDMKKQNAHVILCGVRPEASRTLHAYGLDKRIGIENIFASDTGVFTSAKRALQRARHLVGSSIDASSLKIDDEGEITYEI